MHRFTSLPEVKLRVVFNAHLTIHLMLGEYTT
jgi:hypothetical protein